VDRLHIPPSIIDDPVVKRDAARSDSILVPEVVEGPEVLGAAPLLQLARLQPVRCTRPSGIALRSYSTLATDKQREQVSDDYGCDDHLAVGARS
jgi:hypothetical protein